MEHPGKIWKRLESCVNKYLSNFLPERGLRWLWMVVYFILGGISLLQSIFPCIMCSSVIIFLIHQCYEEKIYDADPSVIDIKHEGQLVRLSGRIDTITPLHDPLTGASINAPWVRREIYNTSPSPESEALLSQYHLRDKLFVSNDWLLGSFRIQHNYDFSQIDEKEAELTAEQIQFTEPAEGIKITPPPPGGTGIKVSTIDDTEICMVEYITCNEPVYIIARQLEGNLYLNGPESRISLSPIPEMNKNGLNATIFVTALACAVFLSGTLCFALSCLRTGLWHATAGKNLLRLPLWQASLLLTGIAICMGSGLGLTLLPLSDEITRYSSTGQVLIIASCGLLAFGIQRYITLGNKRA